MACLDPEYSTTPRRFHSWIADAMMAEPGGAFDIDSIPLLMLLVISFVLPGGPITAERTAQLWRDQSCGVKIVFLYECV